MRYTTKNAINHALALADTDADSRALIKGAILFAFKAGDSIQELSERHGMSGHAIEEIIREFGRTRDAPPPLHRTEGRDA